MSINLIFFKYIEMPAITHTPEVLEFKKLSMLSADGDGEQWGSSYTIGRTINSYKSFGKSFENIN